MKVLLVLYLIVVSNYASAESVDGNTKISEIKSLEIRIHESIPLKIVGHDENNEPIYKSIIFKGNFNNDNTCSLEPKTEAVWPSILRRDQLINRGLTFRTENIKIKLHSKHFSSIEFRVHNRLNDYAFTKGMATTFTIKCLMVNALEASLNDIYKLIPERYIEFRNVKMQNKMERENTIHHLNFLRKEYELNFSDKY